MGIVRTILASLIDELTSPRGQGVDLSGLNQPSPAPDVDEAIFGYRVVPALDDAEGRTEENLSGMPNVFEFAPVPDPLD